MIDAIVETVSRDGVFGIFVCLDCKVRHYWHGGSIVPVGGSANFARTAAFVLVLYLLHQHYQGYCGTKY